MAALKFHGRSKPYTTNGIRRLSCYRCKKEKATQQWNCCSNGNRWLPICLACDIELNRLVLKFFDFANRKRLLEDYIDKMEVAPPS